MLADARALLPAAPGPPRRARGRRQAARGPRRLVRALHAAGRARSQRGARAPAGRSGSTSPAAPICSAARRRCAPICSPASSGRAWPPRPAIADGPGAAWAAARYAAPERQIVPPGGASAALAPLPVAALRLAPELSAMLERLGLARIEHLHPLPRPALTARFGAGSGDPPRSGAAAGSPSRSRRAVLCRPIAPSCRSPSRSSRPRRSRS